MKLKVTRAFLLAGVRQEVGSKIETDDLGLIGLLKSTGKAEECSPSKAKAGPMTTKNTGAVVAGNDQSKE